MALVGRVVSVLDRQRGPYRIVVDTGHTDLAVIVSALPPGVEADDYVAVLPSSGSDQRPPAPRGSLRLALLREGQEGSPILRLTPPQRTGELIDLRDVRNGLSGQAVGMSPLSRLVSRTALRLGASPERVDQTAVPPDMEADRPERSRSTTSSSHVIGSEYGHSMTRPSSSEFRGW